MKRLPLCLLLLCAAPVAAQISLDDYRAEVAAYSLQLKIAAARSDEAAETMARARTGFLPRLSLEGSFEATVRRIDDRERWTFDLLPRLVQTLYGGGAVRAAWHDASLGYDIALCDEEFSRYEVRYAADYAYWNLSATRLYAASMREYVALILSLKEVVDRRFDEGYIAKGDVLMIDTRLSEATYELFGAEQRAAVALHDFNVLRGSGPECEVRQGEGIRDTLPMPARVAYGSLPERRVDYTAALLAAERAEVGVRTARAAFGPQVNVGIGGMWRPYTPNRTGQTYVDGMAFVGVAVPIFHWGERRRAVGAARAVLRQREAAAGEVRDGIVREETNGWTALVQTRAQVEASERNLRIAGENLSLSTYSYGEGLTTILDVLQAQLSWIQLYTNAIRARFNYAVAVSDYARIAQE